MNTDMNHYTISRELYGHEDGVRCVSNVDNMIITGSQDSMVIRWALNDNGDYTNTGLAFDASNWVTAVVGLTSGFVTGSRDKCIRVYSVEGELVRILRGHEGGITSLSLSPTGYLLSGSWDGTGRVWSIGDGTCVQVLPGHENGVSIIGLTNGNIVTASTGKQVGANTIVDYQIRIWNNGKQIKSMKNHTAAVRDLAVVKDIGFVSCSNDGSLILWSDDGNPIQIMSNPVEGTFAGFILSVAVSTSGEFICGGEDCSLRVWKNGELQQTIQHPNTVWGVSCLPNGDIVTACGDKVARVFTRDSGRVGDEATLESYSTAVNNASSAGSESQAVDISKLKPYANRGAATDGKVEMFRKGDTAFAYKFDASCGDWIEIGEVVSSPGSRKSLLNGEEYDRVIDVEMEVTGGGIQTLKLGFNFDETSYEVAQRFISSNPGVQQYHIDQIAQYVQQQRGPSMPTLGMDTATSTPEISIPKSSHFPVKRYVQYDTIKNMSGLNSKLLEFSGMVDMKVPEGLFKEIISTIEATSRYHSSSFSANQYSLLESCLDWPIEQVFPVIDLFRLLLTHPAALETYRSDRGEVLVDNILKKVMLSEESSHIPMLSFRLLCNLCRDCGTSAFKNTDRLNNVLRMVTSYGVTPKATIQQANAGLLLNITIAYSSGKIEVESAASMLDAIKLLLKEANNDATKYRLLAALGTILISTLNGSTDDNVLVSDFLSIISEVKFDKRENSIISDLETLFSSMM